MLTDFERSRIPIRLNSCYQIVVEEARDVRFELTTGFSEQFNDTDRFKSERTVRPIDRTDRQSGWYRNLGTFLKAGESNVQFEAPHVTICWIDSEIDGGSMSEMATINNLEQQLVGLKHNSLRLVGKIAYDGPAGTYRTPVFDGVTHTDKDNIVSSLSGIKSTVP